MVSPGSGPALAQWLMVLCVCAVQTCLSIRTDWYASPHGTDGGSCGSRKNPCQTIGYIVSHTRANNTIHLYSHQGAYINDSSGANYIHIPHSLTIISIDGVATIDCQGKGNKLFNVSGQTEGASQRPTLTLQYLQVKNCINIAQQLGEGCIYLHNAFLKINNCRFAGNALLVYHPQNDISHAPCSVVGLTVTDSTFENNLVSKPYFQSGIELLGCQLMEVNMKNTLFQISPVQIKAGSTLVLVTQNVTFDALGAVRGALLYLGLSDSNATNRISILNSTFRNQLHSQQSPLTIAVNQLAPKPSISLTNIMFYNNVGTKTAGGAMSLFTHFPSPAPVDVRLTMDGCHFNNNSAISSGGAMYLKGVMNVKLKTCMFVNNSAALGGGAILSHASTAFSIQYSVFERNTVCDLDGNCSLSVGGAVQVMGGDVRISNSSFKDNVASAEGHDIYAAETTIFKAMHSNFLSSSASAETTGGVRVFVSNIKQSEGNKGTIVLIGDVFDMSNCSAASVKGGFLDVAGQINNSENKFWCPVGHHTDQSAGKIIRYSLNDNPGRWQRTMCQPCPGTTYNTVKGFSDRHTHNMTRMCLECPEHAVCVQGRAVAVPNYWADISSERATMYLCPRGFCHSAWPPLLPAAPPPQDRSYCTGMHTGPLCTQCPAGFHVDLGTEGCVEPPSCQHNVYWALSMAVVCTMVVVIILVVVLLLNCQRGATGVGSMTTTERTPLLQRQDSFTSTTGSTVSIWDSDPDTSTGPQVAYHPPTPHSSTSQLSPRDTDHASARGPAEVETTAPQQRPLLTRPGKTGSSWYVWLLEVFIFYQTLKLVYTPTFPNDDIRLQLTKPILQLAYLQLPISMTTRVCSVKDLSTIGVLLFDLISAWFVVVFMVVTGLLGFLVSSCLRLGRRHRASDLAGLFWQCYGQLMLCVLLLYFVPQVRALMQLLQCTSLGGEAVLYQDAAIRCHQPWQWVAGFVLVFFSLPMPLCFWIAAVFHHHGFLGTGAFLLSITCPALSLLIWLVQYTPKGLWQLAFKNPHSSPHLTSFPSAELETNTPTKHFIQQTILYPLHQTKHHHHQHQHQQKDAAHGRKSMWVPWLLFRGFLVVASSVLLQPIPSLGSVVLVLVCMLSWVAHSYSKPLPSKAHRRLHFTSLVLLTLASVCNIYGALLYEQGVVAGGAAGVLLDIFDWAYTVLVLVFPLLCLVMLIKLIVELIMRK